MIWQDVLKLLGSGVVGVFIVIAGLFSLSGMTYSTPEDIHCIDCYSPVYINSTYWEVKVEHAGDKPIMFKKMTRSRTLWVNLDKVDGFVPTSPQVQVDILVPTIKKYATIKHPELGYLRPIKDDDKLIERKNEAYNPDGDWFVLHTDLSDVKQTVKYGLELEHVLSEDIIFDPLWIYNAGGSDPSLMAYYKFNGDATDSVGSNDGTVTGALQTSFGKFNSAYEFDGITSSGIDISGVSTGYNHTINIWGKFRSNKSQYFFDAQTGRETLRVYTDGEFHYYNGGWIDTNTLIADNSWHMMTVVSNLSATNSTVLYVDGVQVLSDSDITSLGGSICIGNYYTCSGTAQVVNGTIDEVRIYNTSLSAAEIRELYNETLTSNSIKLHGTQEDAETYAYSDELLADNDMEATGFGNWTAGSGATITKNDTSPHSGTQNLRVAYGGAISNPFASQSIITTGKTYRMTGWFRGDGTATPRIINTAALVSGTSSTDWQYFDVTFVGNGAAIKFYALIAAAGYAEYDDMSIKEIESYNSDQHLVSHWKFNGDATDSAGSNDLTNNAALMTPYGKFNSAYEFDGTNEKYLTITTDDFRTGEATWLLWVNKYDTTTDYAISYRVAGGAYNIYIDSNGMNLVDSINGTSQATTITADIDDGNWHQLGVNFYNNGSKHFFIDGEKQSTADNDGSNLSQLPSGTLLNIGVLVPANALKWNGTIDEIRMYNITLTDAEIRRLYNESVKSKSIKLYGSQESAQTYAYGDTILADGNMEAATNASWSVANSAAISKDTINFHTGSQSLNVSYTSVNNPGAFQSVSSAGTTYRTTGWFRGDGGSFVPIVRDSGAGWSVSGTSSTDWQHFDVVGTSAGISVWLRCGASSAAWCEFDDVVVKEVESYNSDKHLVNHWKFDGNALDSAGSKDGTETGSIQKTSFGKFNSAYKFDAVDDYIAVSLVTANLTSGFSITWWSQALDNTIINSVFGKESTAAKNFILFRDSNLFVMETDTNSDIVSGTYTQDSKWHHYAISCASECWFYEDGIDTTTDGVFTNSNVFLQQIGVRSISTTPFNGTIDEMKIYNVSISADEVYRLYNESLKTKSIKIYGSPESI